jgi:hypothetical protein
MKRHGLWLMAALLFCGAAGLAKATVVLQLELEDLAQLAPVVVLGEVNQVASERSPDGKTLHTRVLVTPSEIWKGKEIQGTISVKFIGGRDDSVVAHLPGAPRFNVGERVLLFLEPREDKDGYLPLGFYQGKFSVFTDPRTRQELLLRDAPEAGVSVVTGPAGKSVDRVRTLAEARALFGK